MRSLRGSDARRRLDDIAEGLQRRANAVDAHAALRELGRREVVETHPMTRGSRGVLGKASHQRSDVRRRVARRRARYDGLEAPRRIGQRRIPSARQRLRRFCRRRRSSPSRASSSAS